MTKNVNKAGGRPARNGLAANDNYRGWAEVRMPSDDVLRSPQGASELGQLLQNVYDRRNLSRRRVIDWMADTIYPFDGDVFNADGSQWDISDVEVDDPFGVDLSFAWIRSLLIFAGTPPKQRMQRRVLPRLRLIYLAIRIEQLAEARKAGNFPPRERV